MWGRNGDSNGRARLISEFLYHSFYSFLNTSVLRETIATICFRFFNLYVDGSIPINTIFSWLFTSINPSYFDVNKKGVQGFDTLPYGYGSKLGTPKLWMVNTKLDIHICGPINGLPFWPTSRCETFAMLDLGRSSRRAMSVSYLQGWPVQRLKSRYWRHRQCFRNSIKMMPIFSSYDIYIYII